MTTGDKTMEDIWVPIRFSPISNQRIKHLRDALREVIPATFIEERDPHISVLPGLRLPANEIQAFSETVQDGIEHPTAVKIDGFSCYPSDEPKVVMLNADVDLESIRQKLLTIITHKAVGGEIKYPAIDPHITLFKGGDGPADDWSLKEEKAARIHSRLTKLEEDPDIRTNWIDQNIELHMEIK